MERFLEGRVAVVTGGFSGIGLAIATEFLNRGAAVAVGSRIMARPEGAKDVARYLESGEAEDVAARLSGLGRSHAGHLDVCDPAAIETFLDTVRGELGAVDILVNAAGTDIEQSLCGHPEDLWLKVIDTNLNGAFRMTAACMPGMVARKWGRILNIASTAAHVGAPNNAAYCASKSGLLGLTRVAALEGAPHGVTCVSLSPTWVETGMMRRDLARISENEGSDKSLGESMDEIAKLNPQQRIVQPEEIAALAAFLCRDDARGITMEDIQVNAGSLW